MVSGTLQRDESNSEAEFEEELEIFRKEVQGATQFFYGFLAVNTAAAKRKAVLDLMNEAPTFWNTATAGLQLAAFIALHRIFDRSAKHSVFNLFRMAERNRHIFSKDALGERKKRGSANALEWLDEYLAKSYVPTVNDFRKLRKLVDAQCRTYDGNYRDIRNKYYAHKEISKKADVDALFSKTNVREVQRIFVFLNQLHEALWQLFINGHRPVLKGARYSVASIRKNRRPGWFQRGVQEIIIHEVDDFFDAAAPNRRRRREKTR